MSFNNIIAIVGDKSNAINLITSKLVLLRDLDKIVDTNLDSAVSFLSQTMPNIIILHSIGDSEGSLNAIKEIKNTEILKDIPILLYSEDCTKEFLIDAFDCGITDIIRSPIADWELLIRVIWCIQRSELITNINSRNEFLIDLGIIQDKTGFYTPSCVEQFLTTEVNSAIKYKNKSCLMLIGPDGKFPPIKNITSLNEIIRKCVRLNDSVGIREDGCYYIYLPKTKLNGAYAVFERINNSLGFDFGINASVIEIEDKDFVFVKNMLEKAYSKTEGATNTILVAHQNFQDEDFENQIKREEPVDIVERRKNIKEKFSKQKSIEEDFSLKNFREDKIEEVFKEKLEENLSQAEENFEEPVKEDFFEAPATEEEYNFEQEAIMQEEPVKNEIEETPQAVKFDEEIMSPTAQSYPALPEVNYGNYTEEEERNAALFRQAYRRKCDLVLKPVFDKFKMQIQSRHIAIDVVTQVEFNQSYFELKLGDKILRLTVNYPGFSKIDIVTEIYLGKERRGYNAFDLDLTEFGFEKLSITLEGLINEYESYL